MGLTLVNRVLLIGGLGTPSAVIADTPYNDGNPGLLFARNSISGGSICLGTVDHFRATKLRSAFGADAPDDDAGCSSGSKVSFSSSSGSFVVWRMYIQPARAARRSALLVGVKSWLSLGIGCSGSVCLPPGPWKMDSDSSGLGAWEMVCAWRVQRRTGSPSKTSWSIWPVRVRLVLSPNCRPEREDLN